MQRRRLGDESWLYYDQEGAMRSDWLGNGVVQHTCRGDFRGDMAAVVIADGKRALREHGRCIFMVDWAGARRVTTEFRVRVTAWLAVHQTIEVHHLLRSKVIEVAIRVANVVLRRTPMKVYSNADRWLTAGRHLIPNLQRLPLVPPDWTSFEPIYEDTEPAELLTLFRHVDATRGAELDGALAVLLAQIRSWAPAFIYRQFAGLVPDIDDLSEDAVQHLLLAVSARKFDLTAFPAEASVMAWCQAVLTNFVLSELRTRRRSSLLPAYSDDRVPHESVDERNAFEVLFGGSPALSGRCMALGACSPRGLILLRARHASMRGSMRDLRACARARARGRCEAGARTKRKCLDDTIPRVTSTSG